MNRLAAAGRASRAGGEVHRYDGLRDAQAWRAAGRRHGGQRDARVWRAAGCAGAR